MGRPALDFPELTSVGGHTGYPWTREMMALATRYDNVHTDTSAHEPRRYPDELVTCMRRHGRRKVLFGSTFPMIQPAQRLPQVEAPGLDEQARQLFLGGNAARVFGLPG